MIFFWMLFFLFLFFFMVSFYVVGYLCVIFCGDYFDFFILCDGVDYYMIYLLFFYVLGFLIWYLWDLVNWEFICCVMMVVVGLVMVFDFVKYGGRYYIYFFVVGVNWVIWFDNICGLWSELIKLEVG